MENISEILKYADEAFRNSEPNLKIKDKMAYIAGYIDGWIDKAKKEMEEQPPTIHRQNKEL
jgi:hypothetical protein